MNNSVQFLLGDDHASLDELLTELEAHIAQSHISRAGELLDLFWARLAMHIRAEHLHLFPALTNAASQITGKGGLPTFEEVEETLARLRSDHDFFMKELSRIIKETRAGCGPIAEDFRARLSVIRKRLETHNKIEEQQLYIWPSLLFDESTIADLNAKLRHELQNLPPRFA